MVNTVQSVTLHIRLSVVIVIIFIIHNSFFLLLSYVAIYLCYYDVIDIGNVAFRSNFINNKNVSVKKHFWE